MNKRQRNYFTKFMSKPNKKLNQDFQRTYIKKPDKKHQYLFLGYGITLLSILLAVSLFFFFVNVNNIIEERSKGILAGMASRNARMLEYEINNKKFLLDQTAKNCESIFQNDRQQVLSKLKQLIGRYGFYDIGIILEDGTFSSVHGENGNFSDAEFFHRAMQ